MSHPLWDLPTRVFHWLLVCLVPLAWLSAETQNFELHEWVGRTLIVLVTWRILWGLLGSRHSRFSDFLVGPGAVLAYLRGQRGASRGHNPLGGWSVMVLLALLLAQGVSGLFNDDDVLYSGPLYYGASEALRGFMGEMHEWAFNLLLGFVGLHVGAVLFHQLRLRHNLLQAMVKGRAAGREGLEAPRPLWLALVVALLLAALLWWGLEQAPKPDPGRWY